MEPIVSSLKIAGSITSLLLSVGVPILLLILWRRKTHAKWTAALWGALIFVVFVFVLEGIFHRLVLYGNSPFSALLQNNIWLYAIYGGLAAGVFEETGRLVAFAWPLKKQVNKETSVMYGIGHGGIEAILLAGVSAVSSLAFMLSLNAMGTDAMLAAAGDSAATVQASIDSLVNTGAGMFFVSGLERMTAITLHISLSVLVFLAVQRKKWILYPLAILLHAAVDFCAVLYQGGFITSIILIEAIIAAATAAVAVFAYKLYQKDVNPAEGSPAPLQADAADTPALEETPKDGE